MTGGDPITCRYLFGLEFTYAPLFTPIFVTNHKPIVRGTEHAIWRRLRLVEFGVRIPDERQDKRLKGALHTELPGILAWAVRGCLDWQRDGLPTPEAVRLATADYRADMDAVGQFLAEGCVLADGCRVTASALYAAYKDWIEGIGARPLGYRALRADLLGRGLPAPVMASAGPHKGQMTWRGIGLAAGRTDGPVEEVEEVEEKAEASLVMPAHREPSGNSSTSSTSSTGPVSVRTSGDAARVNGSEPRPGPSGPGPARSFRWRDWSERP
jgi:putative DNA primase/helicase